MLKKIVIGFGLLVLIAIVLGCGKYAPWTPFRHYAAVKNVNEEHAAAVIEGDEIFRSRVFSLQQLGIMGEKVAESKADTCYIEPICVGLGCSTWEQFCRLDYVAGYTALLSREETFDRIEAASLYKESPTFPKRLHWSNRGGCRYSPSPSPNVIYVPANFIPKSEYDGCRIPDRANGVGPFGAGMPGNTKFDYTFDPDAIDQSVDLLWITYTHRYYREDIGCSGLLCMNSPRSKPIQAD
jgi:hypothetical protein